MPIIILNKYFVFKRNVEYKVSSTINNYITDGFDDNMIIYYVQPLRKTIIINSTWSDTIYYYELFYQVKILDELNLTKNVYYFIIVVYL